ncbi:NAD-dependent epimerase/dehydratase family protein [Roseibium suaedae]|uniref:UDP-glucose 4-epimerase n=1 Tax=Roseibium suaedae TaxID=735517 RepID=A0A1M7P016_9HYPH|nr:NAD-dependent epimerase/dehydratase family protein [Roseibium suaedae]SHN09779.1 UDP-glucose 4-epimerase [Roseibium suaedae]
MHVLIIGGCGFVGSHVVDKCLAEGMAVRVLDPARPNSRIAHPEVDYVRGHLEDQARLPEFLSGIDAVVHLASTTIPSSSNLDPASDISGNLIPMIRLLEAMREHGPRKLVFLSSGGTIYGIPNMCPVPETHLPQPICSYGVVKAAMEHYLQMEQHLHGLQATILRPSNIYGPRQGRLGVQGVIGTYLHNLSLGLPIEVWGDGSVIRDFLYVQDFADICHQALMSSLTGCFNAGSGTGISIRDLIGRIQRTVGGPVHPIYRDGRGFDVPRVVLDISKVNAAFGWTPRVGLDEGLAGTWNWVSKCDAA